LIRVRLLLIIPVLVLFLSNVPFIQEIPLEKALAMMQENGTCGKDKQCGRATENLVTDCNLEESSCEKPCTGEAPNTDAEKDCCENTETSCICIYCFQYAAPVHVITEYQFNCSIFLNAAPIFILGLIKDQHVGAPWQPPDLV
jgi:hypothetical protein